MISRLAGFLVVLLACLFSGCQSTKTEPQTQITAASMATAKKEADPRVRNNAVGLLYDLLSDEKNVSLVLIIKRESKGLHELIKTISETAGQEAKVLEDLAKADPSLDIHTLALPPGEIATRDAIEDTKKHDLLHSKGADFEFALLLTQVQALSYGTHLAHVAALNETRSEHALKFAAISNDLKQLYDRAVAQMRAAR